MQSLSGDPIGVQRLGILVVLEAEVAAAEVAAVGDVVAYILGDHQGTVLVGVDVDDALVYADGEVETILSVVVDLIGGDAAVCHCAVAVVVEAVCVVDDGVELDCFHFLFLLCFWFGIFLFCTYIIAYCYQYVNRFFKSF